MQLLEISIKKPENITLFSTMRVAGNSLAPYDKGNLALHVNDQAKHVKANRQALLKTLGCQSIHWLNQTHSNRVLNLDHSHHHDADASYSTCPGQACTVLTADCVPVLLFDQYWQEVAAIHAGWRGLASGIIANTVMQFRAKTDNLIAWIGPCIHMPSYEVNQTLLHQFTAISEDYRAFFHSLNQNIHADLPGIAQYQCQILGVGKVYVSPYCTYSMNHLFYSYRRNQNTGRQATGILIHAPRKG